MTASLRPEGQTPPCDFSTEGCNTPTGTSNPLLALGGGTCFGGVDGLGISGHTTAHIYGGVIIDTNMSNCDELQFNGNANSYTSGTISILQGGTCSGCPNGVNPSSFPTPVPDPFAGVQPPPDTCGTGPDHPAQVTDSGGVLHYRPGTYRTAVTVNATGVIFDSGVYVFCVGLAFGGNAGSVKYQLPLNTNANALTTVTVSDASSFNTTGGTFMIVRHDPTSAGAGYPYYFSYTGVSGNMLTDVKLLAGLGTTKFSNIDDVYPAASSAPGGVLFYFTKGPGVPSSTLAKQGGAAVALTALSDPNYAPLVIWQDKNDTTTPMAFQGNGPLNINGTLYAPSIEVQLLGTVDTAVKSIVAGTVTFGGDHTVGVGVPPPPLTISGPATLPNSTVGAPYPCNASTTITVTGGSGAGNIFSATGLPANMTLNPTTGRICGTPTVAGPVTVTVTVTDSFGDIATTPMTFTVNAAPSINNVPLPDWTINRPYSDTPMGVTGGTPPFDWSQTTGLPTGMTIDGSTGIVHGTPTASGTFAVTIKAIDTDGVSATRPYTMHINPKPRITGPPSLPDWTAGAPYQTTTMQLSGGTGPPYLWSQNGLPTGVDIDPASGTISGTPLVAGTFDATIAVTDVAGASDTLTYNNITIHPGPGISTTQLDEGEQGRPYYFLLTPTSGGTAPYTWSWDPQPAGLSLNPDTGEITGTPSSFGTTNITVTITDKVGATGNQIYSLVIAKPVAISPSPTLQDWTAGRQYPNVQITATDGIPNSYTWSATLPPGLQINPSTGVVSGTPTTPGTWPVTITVTDTANGTSSATYNVTINPPPSLSATPLPSGYQNVFYNYAVPVTDGTGPFTWSQIGLDNSGLSIDPSSGVISGFPTTSGTIAVSVTVVDAAGVSANQDYTLTLAASPHLVLSAATTTPNAGVPDQLTITVEDSLNATLTSYNGPHSLTFTGASQSAGGNVPTVTNSSGNAVAFGSPTTITFTNGVASVSGGAGVMTLYKPEVANVVVSDGKIDNSPGLSVTVGAAPVNKLVFIAAPAGNQTATNTANIGPYQVQQQDQYGNPITAGSDTTVTLTTNSTGTRFFSLTSNGASGTAVTTVTIPSGQSTTGNFYYSDTKAGSPTLRAHNAGIPNDATTSPTIVGATPAAIVLTQRDSEFRWTAQLAVVSPNYTCSWSGAASNASLTAKVSFVDAFGNLAIASASTSSTINLTTPSKGTVSPSSLTVLAGQTTTSGMFTLTKQGGNTATTTITFGSSFTLTLSLS